MKVDLMAWFGRAGKPPNRVKLFLLALDVPLFEKVYKNLIINIKLSIAFQMERFYYYKSVIKLKK